MAIDYSTGNKLNKFTLEATMLGLDDIMPSPLNPRKRFDDEALAELAESIKLHGILEPLVVRTRPLSEAVTDSRIGPFYELIAGERRWRAARLAGLLEAPAVVRDVDDNTAVRLMMIENLQRQDLDPIDEALGYRALAEQGLRQREIAEAVGKKQPDIAKRLALLELPEGVQTRIRAGELSPAHGVAIAARYKEFPKVAEKVAETAAANGLTVKSSEEITPFVAELKKARLLKEFGYDDRPDQECRDCAKGAFRVSGGYWGICLDLACFAERAKRKAEAEKARAEATRLKAENATAAGKVYLANLAQNTWRNLGAGGPDGCHAECENRGEGLDYADRPVPICTDPACYKDLQEKAAKRDKELRQQLFQEAIETLHAEIDGLGSLGGREWAVLAAKLLGSYLDGDDKEIIAAAFDRHGIGELAPIVDGSDWVENDFPRLADAPPLALAKALLEVKITQELVRRHIEGYQGLYQWARGLWYVGQLELPPPDQRQATDEIEAAQQSDPCSYCDGSGCDDCEHAEAAEDDPPAECLRCERDDEASCDTCAALHPTEVNE